MMSFPEQLLLPSFEEASPAIVSNADVFEYHPLLIFNTEKKLHSAFLMIMEGQTSDFKYDSARFNRFQQKLLLNTYYQLRKTDQDFSGYEALIRNLNPSKLDFEFLYELYLLGMALPFMQIQQTSLGNDLAFAIKSPTAHFDKNNALVRPDLIHQRGLTGALIEVQASSDNFSKQLEPLITVPTNINSGSIGDLNGTDYKISFMSEALVQPPLKGRPVRMFPKNNKHEEKYFLLVSERTNKPITGDHVSDLMLTASHVAYALVY